MFATSRARFIWLVVTGYVLVALAWIFLSDRLLLAVGDAETVVSLSSLKGLFFVLVSSAVFLVALRAVPPETQSRSDAAPEPMMAALVRAVVPDARWHKLMYVFALAATSAMLLLRANLPVAFSERPMLMLFTLPIIVSALLGGLGPGLLATATAALGVDAWVSPPLHSAMADRHSQVEWALLVVNGLVLSGLSEVLRQTLRRVAKGQSLLDAVVSGTSDAIFVKDLDGRYVLANGAMAALVHRPRDDVLGRGDSTLFDPSSADIIRHKDKVVLRTGEVETHEEALTTLDGQGRICQITRGPVHDSQGRIIGLFGISRDITEARLTSFQLKASEERLQRVIEATSDGIWDWDVAHKRIFRSARCHDVLGTRAQEDAGDVPFLRRQVHPEDWPQARAAILAHLKGETPSIEFDFRPVAHGDTGRWAQLRGKVVDRDTEGHAVRVVGTLSDVTDRKRHDLATREAAIVFERSYEGIMVVDPDGLITKVNPAFTRITGYAEAEALGQSPKMLSSGQHGGAFYKEMWESLKEHDFWRGEIWNRRKSGEVYAELLSISVVRDKRGHVQYYIGVFADISQLKAHEAELDRVAHYDALTGLPNRRLLSDRLQQSIARSARKRRSSAVCFLDLDGFKAVNDLHGHAVGDQLLVAVTERLKLVLRADDTLARLGGDEFVLILSDVATPEECTMILDRVLDAASKPVDVAGLTVQVSVSIGATLYPQDNADADTLLRHADQAMYMAKSAGKNRYQLFDPESDRKAQTHRMYLELLRQALARREFTLYYQPKVDLLNGEVVGAEALIRWLHPDKGVLLPAEFLPHVHGSNLETPFGEWVIEAALAQQAQWAAMGLQIKVSVNVSAAHLLQASFFAQLQAALARHPSVPPSAFEIEVLETAAIGDIQQAVKVLAHCKALGVRLSLDDFGTGYSSLSHLRQLPVDTLKIDQRFVQGMLENSDDLRTVESAIQLAGVFKRQVLAEGVETLAHGAMLRRLGCRLAQGFGIGKPMAAKDFPAWCAAWQKQAAWLQMPFSDSLQATPVSPAVVNLNAVPTQLSRKA